MNVWLVSSMKRERERSSSKAKFHSLWFNFVFGITIFCVNVNKKRLGKEVADDQILISKWQ